MVLFFYSQNRNLDSSDYEARGFTYLFAPSILFPRSFDARYSVRTKCDINSRRATRESQTARRRIKVLKMMDRARALQ